jgi:Alpha-mannosidase
MNFNHQRHQTDTVFAAEQPRLRADRCRYVTYFVKLAEDSDDLIFRLYEAYNKQTDVTVSLGFASKRVALCDLMENESLELVLDGDSFTLPVKPFEVITGKVER